MLISQLLTPKGFQEKYQNIRPLFPMLISQLLTPDRIKLALDSRKRCQAIHEVAYLLESHPNVIQFKGFYDEILARERVEPTCLGNGIAFPHARTDHIKGMVLSVGRSREGVLFENCQQTVRLIFVIGTPKRMAMDYLSVVGALARILKEQVMRDQLLNVATAEEFIEAIADAEAKI